MMMSMIGKKTLKVKARSVVSQISSGGPVEISFVLDMTSSMNNFGANWNQIVNALEDLMTELESNAGKMAVSKHHWCRLLTE